MKPVAPICRNCHHYERPTGPKGGLARKSATKCQYVVEWPPLPISISKWDMERLPKPGWVDWDRTDECPCFKAKG